ncbi:MAG: hypothetical protein VCC36_14105 [Gammaproteobacteria bacterium]
MTSDSLILGGIALGGRSLSYEVFDPNDSVDEDDQTRASLVWEFSPMQLLQPRIGVRLYDGIPASDLQNRDEFFAELHVFF